MPELDSGMGYAVLQTDSPLQNLLFERERAP